MLGFSPKLCDSFSHLLLAIPITKWQLFSAWCQSLPFGLAHTACSSSSKLWWMLEPISHSDNNLVLQCNKSSVTVTVPVGPWLGTFIRAGQVSPWICSVSEICTFLSVVNLTPTRLSLTVRPGGVREDRDRRLRAASMARHMYESCV